MDPKHSRNSATPVLALSLLSLACSPSTKTAETTESEEQRAVTSAQFSTYEGLFSARNKLAQLDEQGSELQEELDVRIEEQTAKVALSAVTMTGATLLSGLLEDNLRECAEKFENEIDALERAQSASATFKEYRTITKDQGAALERSIEQNTALAQESLTRLLRLPSGWSIEIPPIPEEGWDDYSNPFYVNSDYHESLTVTLKGPYELDYPLELEVTADCVRVDLDSMIFVDEKAANTKSARECHLSDEEFAEAYPLNSLPQVLTKVMDVLKNLQIGDARFTELQIFGDNPTSNPPTIILRPGIKSKEGEPFFYANLTGLIELPQAAQREGRLPPVLYLESDENSKLIYLSKEEAWLANMPNSESAPSPRLMNKIAQVNAVRAALAESGDWSFNIDYYSDEYMRVPMTRIPANSRASEDFTLFILPPSDEVAELQFQFGSLTLTATGAKALTNAIAATCDPKTERIFSITTSAEDKTVQVVVVSSDQLHDVQRFAPGQPLALESNAVGKLVTFNVDELGDMVSQLGEQLIGQITHSNIREQGEQRSWSYSVWQLMVNDEAKLQMKIPHGIMCGTGLWESPKQELVAGNRELALVGGLVDTQLVDWGG